MESKLSYEQVDEIVQGYKQNKPGYSQMLIEAFEGFLHQYVSMLVYGTIDVKKDRLRRFLSLFVSSEISSKFNQWRYNPSIKKEIYAKTGQLSGLFKSFTEEDIKHEAIATLLEMANMYKRLDRPTFCYFLDKMFNIYFKNNLEAIIQDPLVCSSWLHYDDDTHSKCSINYNKIIHNIDQDNKIANTELAIVNDKQDYNFNWINGITSDGPFRMLHPKDREILVLYYINKLTDDEIAYKLNFKARETVNRRRHRAIERIEQYGKDNKLLRLREGVPVYNKETTQMRKVCGEV